MTDNIFGPDRDDEPGITPQPGRIPPQLTNVMVESAGMVSRSLGVVPCVVLRFYDEEGGGYVCSIAVGDDLKKIISDMRTAGARAIVDVQVAKDQGVFG